VLYGQSNALFIDQNGNVGIGIGNTMPQNLLHVGSGMSTIAKDRVTAVIASQTVDAGIAIAQQDNVNVLLQAAGAGGYIGTTSNHPLMLRTSNADRVAIDKDGNVSMFGTLTAKQFSGTLDVRHGTRTGETHPTAIKGLYVTGDFSEEQGVEFRHNNGTQGIGFGSNTIYATGSNADQDLKLKPRGTGTVAIATSQENLFISSRDGTVSVTNNAYRNASNNWALKNTNKKAFTFEIRDSGMLELYGTQTNGQTDWRKMATFDAVNNKVEFPSGNVHVSGDLIVDGTITATKSIQTKDVFKNRDGWFLYAGGTPIGRPGAKDALWDTSDVRLKTDIHPIPTALEKVSHLRGVTYRWNQEAFEYFTRGIEQSISAGPEATAEEHQQHLRAAREKVTAQHAGSQIGLIAQEVESVVPEVVTTDEAGYKAIKYPHLTALLIEALKEQQALIEAQRADIRLLQASTMALQAQVQDMQARSAAAHATQAALEDIRTQLAQLSAAVQHAAAPRKAGTTDVGQVIMPRQ
jgi:hypothetical protein